MKTATTLSPKAPYQLCPPLKAEELTALRTDIEQRGVQVAVELDEDGNILDGHHRVAIADELGITDYPTVIRRGLDEQAKREHVIALNLNRRHLAPHEWGLMFAQILEMRGVERGQGARNDNGTCATVAQVAADLGVPKRTAFQRLRDADDYKKLPQAKQDQVDGGQVLLDVLKENIREKKAAEDKQLAAEHRAKFKLPNDCGVITGDFYEYAKTMADNSVDLIFTDPPYDRKSVYLYGKLAEVGARVLKPGGSLICEVGNYAIPDILDLMRPHLRYYWTCSLIHTGAKAHMKRFCIKVAWKPYLWFVKEDRRQPREYILDCMESEREKGLHPWQQGRKQARYYIEKLTNPGDLVFDPFCGSGTFALVAKELGRKWITCELDPDTATLARKRIREGKSP